MALALSRKPALAVPAWGAAAESFVPALMLLLRCGCTPGGGDVQQAAASGVAAVLSQTWPGRPVPPETSTLRGRARSALAAHPDLCAALMDILTRPSSQESAYAAAMACSVLCIQEKQLDSGLSETPSACASALTANPLAVAAFAGALLGGNRAPSQAGAPPTDAAVPASVA